ncbi:MAG: aminotransferase class I/II-fold pyridoxal phosphate-dependent enzyme [Oscillospiraceae bacterium]|nr:aminotransferase class I/II-fold pyridoxal phosphate-dependent enzyme [Oscillospiraceae bacterium]
MFNLPNKLKDFTPYQPLTGEYKIRLDVNESFIKVDPDIVKKAIEEINLNRYPDPYATEAVRAFSELFNVNEKFVTAGNGSDELIMIIASALLEKGDKVLCFTPDFPMYKFYSNLYELQVTEMSADIDKAIAYINQNNIKCIMFSNPCNPTSLGIEKREILRLIENISALVILDEAYIDFWNEDESMLKTAHNYNNLIVLRTCSKAVALAGIRLGFAIANERLTTALKAAKSPYNVNALSQAIGTAVLSDKDNYINSITLIKKSIFDLRNSLVELDIFDEIYDTKTNFVYCKTDKAREIYEYLLTKGIAVRCFGNALRICAGTDLENIELLKEVQQWKTQK